MEKVYIGVDIGGMSLKGGIVNKNGDIAFKSNVKLNVNNENNKTFLDSLKHLLNELLIYSSNHNFVVIGIGFGVPGFVDNNEGIIESTTNLNISKLNLKEELKYLNVPLFLSNDANVACLAEIRFGIAKKYSNAVMLTIGTGIGSGIVINDQLFEGNEGKGAEIGHMTLVVDGNKCNCGRKGCFEAYASATALIKYTKEAMLKNHSSLMWEYVNNDIENVNGLTAFECSKKLDSSACFVVDKFIKYLSEGILSLCNIFRPQVIIIGGGISNQGDYLITKIKNYCEKFKYGFSDCPKPEIVTAYYKNDAGIIGAACLVMDNVKDNI